MMRILLAVALALTAFAALPSADAAVPEAGPGGGRCGELPGMDPCWDGKFFCVWFSLQVPQCIANDPRDAIGIQSPDLPPLVGQCNFVTDPCWDGSSLCVWFSLQVPQCVGPIETTASTGPAIGPLVGQCNDLTKPCWNDALVCVGFSYQVPQCVDDPRDDVAVALPPLPPLVGQCNFATNPCWDDSIVCVWFSLQVPQCVDPVRVD